MKYSKLFFHAVLLTTLAGCDWCDCKHSKKDKTTHKENHEAKTKETKTDDKPVDHSDKEKDKNKPTEDKKDTTEQKKEDQPKDDKKPDDKKEESNPMATAIGKAAKK